MGRIRSVSVESHPPCPTLSFPPTSDFRISFTEERNIRCTAYTLDGAGKPTTLLDKYETGANSGVQLFSWVQKTIAEALTK